jgi:ankyrin repeat protein
MKTLLPLVCSLALLHAGDFSQSQIRESAAKALAVIQHSQQDWYHKQSCGSCHQQYFPALAFHAARQHGIPFDAAAARASDAAAFSYFSNLPRAVEYYEIIDPASDDALAILAANAAGLQPSLVTAVYARLIAARQQPDGRWETFDERPPQSYSPFTATATALRAIQLYSHASLQADTQSRLLRARAWLLSHSARSTEERSQQLLGLHSAAASPAALDKLAAALLATQQPDGGWNSLDGRRSDAYSTGEALIALHTAAALPTTSPAYQRGLAFLLHTQAPDGSWHVTSRLHPPAPVSPPYFETGHPYGHDQFISAMGECLAVIAIAHALPAANPASLTLAAAQPSNLEPWAETLLFGSANDVRQLLDSGFNPNSVTSSGLPALLLAAPDTAKLKLLLDRGANPDSRSKDRFSALLVAAQYPNSSAAINLLLDRGAHVRLPKGQGAPRANASALFLAAYSNNNNVLPRLFHEGGRLDEKMLLIGMFPDTPMMALAASSQTAAAAALLNLGANVNEVDADGISLLQWAAIANRTDMARLLISRGADLNHTDHKGMTALLYAASIDFGDSAMLDLLLKSGANPNARTPQGLTSLGLARKYHHTHLLASLANVHPHPPPLP